MEEVLNDWKEASVILILKIGKKEDPISRLISLTSVPGNIMEQVLFEAISKYMKDKRVTSSSKHRFMKGKSCLNNLVAFYDKMPIVTDKRMVVNVVYFDFI